MCAGGKHGALEETLGAEGKSLELLLCLPSADPQPTPVDHSTM